jgi:hypothetical protein
LTGFFHPLRLVGRNSVFVPIWYLYCGVPPDKEYAFIFTFNPGDDGVGYKNLKFLIRPGVANRMLGAPKATSRNVVVVWNLLAKNALA